MAQIPSDDILEGLYKFRMRESEKLKTVLELYNMEIHQKKAGPDYHRLKTMVKRSIEQNLRMKNFQARNGNFETSAVVKNKGTKQREQRTLGDCWQWETNAQCSKGDNCSHRQVDEQPSKRSKKNGDKSAVTIQLEPILAAMDNWSHLFLRSQVLSAGADVPNHPSRIQPSSTHAGQMQY